jgi:SAM-dependent methyltransferase
MRRDPNVEQFFPRLRPSSIDVAPLRRRQKASFESAVGQLDLDRVLDVGSGRQPWRPRMAPVARSYVAVDLSAYPGSPPPDVQWDGLSLPVRDNWATTVLLTEVLEHTPEPGVVLAEIQRVLDPQGSLYFTVPFLWPVHDAPHDQYRYTPFAMARLMSGAGLELSDMWALGGWDASLAQLLGLWARRRPMHRIARAAASIAALPMVWALDRHDRSSSIDGNRMITGLAGLAVPTTPPNVGRMTDR